MTIFQSTGREYKGNLHLHTTRSDGRLQPLDALAAYEQAGYDFLAITDHRTLTRVPEYRGRMLLLPGIELDQNLSDSECVHLLGIGMTASFPEAIRSGLPSQEAIDLIHAHSGLCFLAHPCWSMNRPETLRALRGLDGVEIFNSVSRPPHNPDRAEATWLLDLLASGGLLLPTLANDDTHHYEQELFGGFILLQADSLSHGDVLRALREGRYYASQGPRFEQVSLTGDTVHVTCSPAQSITFHSNLPWNDRRCAVGKDLTTAAYTLNRKNGERFVRVIIQDEQGRKAWMQPFAV